MATVVKDIQLRYGTQAQADASTYVAKVGEVVLITDTKIMLVGDGTTQVQNLTAFGSISEAQLADIQDQIDAKADALGSNDNYVTDAEKTKLSNIAVTQAVDLDTIETNSNASKAKTDYISVTQAVDLDTMESDITTLQSSVSSLNDEVDTKQTATVAADNTLPASCVKGEKIQLLNGKIYEAIATNTWAEMLSAPSAGSSALQVLRRNAANTANEYATVTETIGIACSDETTSITTGTGKATFRMPFAMTVSSVRATLTTASSSGAVTVDINDGGATILSTKLTIDESEKTSTTAATHAVISDTALADDAEITIDIDGAGTGAAGLKVYITGVKG